MTTQRPVSEQFNLQPAKSGSNSQYRQSADLSHLNQQQTSHRSSRPTSEIFSANNHNTYQSPEGKKKGCSYIPAKRDFTFVKYKIF